MMEGDKAPGPDDFPIAFYKVYWEIVKDDMMQVLADFHDRGFLKKGSNVTFILLISKKDGADRLSDFRSISLIGSTYKIISKCLALRLKTVLPDIVSKEYKAFFVRR